MGLKSFFKKIYQDRQARLKAWEHFKQAKAIINDNS